MSALDDTARRLILACEIAGYLHDLGKLHPGFAGEKLDGGKAVPEPKDRPSTGIGEAHGRILEEGRVYPEVTELAGNPALATLLARLKHDPAWAVVLALPPDIVAAGTVQATGLGMALRQHHAGNKFPEAELSLLGDLYMYAADFRDSALDKGSGGTGDGDQKTGTAEIADAFGLTRANYSEEALQACWQEAVATLEPLLLAPNATADLAATRKDVLDALAPLFAKALGETRRPTHDVTLRHHAGSTASFFKAAVAEGLLRQDFKAWQDGKGLFDPDKLGRIRFRLLGIRWDWAALTRGMLSPTALVSLSGRRREVVENLRALFESERALGNVIYEDDDGVLVLAPGFFEDDSAASEALFARHVLNLLQDVIADAVQPLGTGTPFRLCWSEPTLYLTDYADALGAIDSPRRRHLQADEAALRALWDAANASDRLMQICPQCSLRPAETREFALTESAVRAQGLCNECTELSDRDAKRARARHLSAEFGFRTTSFNLEDLAMDAESARVALFSVRIDAAQIADGSALITQLARPVGKLKDGFRKGIETANALGDWFETLLADLRAGKAIDKDRAERTRSLLGDTFWLKESDGRGKPLDVVRDFFLRESAALPDEWQLARRDGDRLALFAQRKHPSPARLQRLWDDLRDLWRSLANDLAGELQSNLIPFSLDARGLRFAVAATDANTVVHRIGDVLSQRFAKLRGALAAHVSCVVTRPKFPLYLALDALERMERRIPVLPRQTWKVVKRTQDSGGKLARIDWLTPQGNISWNVDMATSDPAQTDHWHPHVIVGQRGGKELTGPDRIVHVAQLQGGDEVLIPPATIDFVSLEGSARRHQLVYDCVGEELRRPHWVMGTAGRAPLLLDAFGDFASLLKLAGWDTGKAKRLQGEMVETYEKWVRDVPESLQTTGREAWHAHLRNMLRRYAVKTDDAGREILFNAIIDGRFFDAVEWATFVSKSAKHADNREAA
jgi:hypothetical protein